MPATRYRRGPWADFWNSSKVSVMAAIWDTDPRSVRKVRRLGATLALGIGPSDKFSIGSLAGFGSDSQTAAREAQAPIAGDPINQKHPAPIHGSRVRAGSRADVNWREPPASRYCTELHPGNSRRDPNNSTRSARRRVGCNRNTHNPDNSPTRGMRTLHRRKIGDRETGRGQTGHRGIRARGTHPREIQQTRRRGTRPFRRGTHRHRHVAQRRRDLAD
jgi:hypothetical protein